MGIKTCANDVLVIMGLQLKEDFLKLVVAHSRMPAVISQLPKDRSGTAFSIKKT
jgi:hypothetical protein